jgi:hypothetical protein
MPEAYKYMITQDIMIKPVICILDGKTYFDMQKKYFGYSRMGLELLL